MPTDASITIAVSPAAALAARPRLFAALEAAFPLTFEAWRPGSQAAGVLVLADDPGAADAPQGEQPVLVVADSDPGAVPFEDARLQDVDAVDRRVRGVTLRERPVGGSLDTTGAVLAATGSAAIWTREPGARPVDRVRAVLPELEDDEVLYSLLSRRAIAMVALMHFLRARSASAGWRTPPLRAAFVFDDPNLRWRSYGFIDYRRLLAHADAHGYHAAMAMIPLDASWPHRSTVSLFARRADRLSLVFHGNDHIRNELLMPADDRTALALAAQAVRRIRRFERRHGIAVDRVMMPPHGRCSEHMARALSSVGMDALCAVHPVPWTAERPSAPPLVAWNPAEFVGGCAVMPRDAICSTVADIALRALLDHPVVIYGHHEDVAGGLEPLAEAAARVNRLGDVRWTSVGEIARTNHSHRLSGDRLVVRPYSRRISVDMPEGATTLEVAAPVPVGELELRGWSVGAGAVLPFDMPARLPPGRHEVRLHGVREIDPDAVGAPAWRPWPALRRAGTELRDRAVALRPVRTA